MSRHWKKIKKRFTLINLNADSNESAFFFAYHFKFASSQDDNFSTWKPEHVPGKKQGRDFTFVLEDTILS